jgi:addiction module RelE/StbE family toxin
MRLRYTADALAHLQSIFAFIDERNPAAARRVIADIRAAAERLRGFPALGRNGQQVGTREWVVQGSPYILVYEVGALVNEVVILGVFHGAQARFGQVDPPNF